MIDIRPFKVEDLREFEPAERNGRAKQEAMAPMLEQAACSFTAYDDFGVIGCGGLIPIHEDRLLAWTSVSNNPRSIIHAVRLLREYLGKQTARRIETVVDVDDEVCHKWVKALGFSPEGPPMLYFNRDGSAAQLYVRYNHDGA